MIAHWWLLFIAAAAGYCAMIDRPTLFCPPATTRPTLRDPRGLRDALLACGFVMGGSSRVGLPDATQETRSWTTNHRFANAMTPMFHNYAVSGRSAP